MTKKKQNSLEEMEADLQKSLKELLIAFDVVDELYEPNTSNALRLLIKKYKTICLRMDGSKNHNCPHIHVDYKEKKHAASYAIKK